MTTLAPWSRDEFEAHLRARGAGYHVHHPFNVAMNDGLLRPDQIRGWVANRFYYQVNIPQKDGAIIANCPDRATRRRWVRRIVDHDGWGDNEGGIEAWVRLGEAVGLTREALWSQRHSVFLGIAPDGTALPCHAARTLPGIAFPNVRETSVHDIWYASGAFNRYRGDAWMKDPCRTCDDKARDFGGCRCQAYALTGEAADADPVCAKSARHGELQAIVMHAQRAQEDAVWRPARTIVFRSDANSRAQPCP
jgi:radical SAM protein with 4Fe4S-binding SPASM domain